MPEEPFAGAIDVDMKNTTEIMVAAAKHKGASVEVLQNCIIFNNGIHNKITDRAESRKTVMLRHGEKMLFGKENDRGIVLDGWNLKAVTSVRGYTIDDVLVHDATTPDNTLHISLMVTQRRLRWALSVQDSPL